MKKTLLFGIFSLMVFSGSSVYAASNSISCSNYNGSIERTPGLQQDPTITGVWHRNDKPLGKTGPEGDLEQRFVLPKTVFEEKFVGNPESLLRYQTFAVRVLIRRKDGQSIYRDGKKAPKEIREQVICNGVVKADEIVK